MNKLSKQSTLSTAYKEYNQADKIIRYLKGDSEGQGQESELTAMEQKNLSRCKKIHGYRMQFKRKKDIAAILAAEEGISTRQVYTLMNLTEQIFGPVERFDKEYERNFLLENSRKGLEIAFASRNSLNISKALMAHYKIAGLDQVNPDMPDFTLLEQHLYQINLPEPLIELLKSHLQGGVVRMENIMPPPSLKSLDAEDIEPEEEESEK